MIDKIKESSGRLHWYVWSSCGELAYVWAAFWSWQDVEGYLKNREDIRNLGDVVTIVQV